MVPLILGRAEFRDKVLGCWLGKNIGGTLGAPHEGKRYALGLEFYEPLPTAAAANDDLDLQLVWLRCLEECGLDPGVDQLAAYWNRYADAYPWDEYGFFMRNYHRGLRPPVAGAFENHYIDNMGSPIRSEIWAVLHAGDPDAAARMAWKDSALDHAGGEGTWGEMFWAAVEAAAFVESDTMTLIRIGLNAIPLSSQVGRAIREAVSCHERGLAWGDARERIATYFATIHPCHAVPNHGFTVLGWLYGRDFGERLLRAVNCGYDTDCTGATLGSVLGIIHGASGIPQRWIDPIGRGIVTHQFTRIVPPPPATLDELTERSIALAERAATPQRRFGEATVRPADLATRLHANHRARACWSLDIHAGVERAGGHEVWLHYGGEPVLRPGIAREWTVEVDGRTERVELRVPAGWTCERLGDAAFRVASAGAVEPRNRVEVVLADGGVVGFGVLGPAEARGFPIGTFVPKCPKCHARVEACICAAAVAQMAAKG